MNKSKSKKIYIAGHNGMVGSAIMRRFRADGYDNLLVRSRKELDLTDQMKVNSFFACEKPEQVIIAAAKVGGILANDTYRADFIYENMMIESNIIHAAFLNNVEKLLFLGSSCIYPKYAPQPMKEEYLLTGALEYTNEPYAIAKIAGIKLCENYYKQYGCNYFSVMPTNLYGINDNFDLRSSHVLPGLMHRFHEAKHSNADFVEVWGSGRPKREFLFVDDLADAVLYLMNNIEAKMLYDRDITHINIGTGKDLSIYELAEMIKDIVGFKGEIKFDQSKPDGTPQKLLDVSLLNNLGWKYSTDLENGIKATYKWYLENSSFDFIKGN